MDLNGYEDSGSGISEEDSSPKTLVKRGEVRRSLDPRHSGNPIVPSHSTNGTRGRMIPQIVLVSVLDCDRWVGINAEFKGPLREDVWTIEKGGDQELRSV